MTSKQALEIFKDNCVDYDLIAIIEQDLEMLEIFKKINFKMLQPFDTMHPKVMTLELNDNITEEEYEKWLKWKEKYEQKTIQKKI